MTSASYRTGPLLLAAAVFALDRITKIAIERSVSVWDSYPIIPNVLNIVYTRNTGAAFGLLRDAPETVRLAVLVGGSLLILLMIAWMLWRDQTPGRWALALILGGAAGNLYDRILIGSVTDFIQVFLGSYEWPSFNVADSAICVGAVLIALDLLKGRKYVPQAN